LQQNLSSDQVDVLQDAGDDKTLMVAPSEISEAFNENRILYKKELINGVDAFVFSNNPEDELFSVRFTLVGENQGNYILTSTSAINNIFEYIEPVSGVSQGNYEPIIQLIAPTKLQVAVVNGSYKPSEKTNIYFEASASKNDLNLFSNLNDNDNDGLAGKIIINQSIIKTDSLWNLVAFVDGSFIQKEFRTIQRLNKAIEFNRDWNLELPQGDQQLLNSGLHFFNPKKGDIKYNFEHLNYSKNFNGNRHSFSLNFNLNNWNLLSNSSALNAKSNITSSNFIRSFNRIKYSFRNQWVGTKLAFENNEQEETTTQQLTPLSQKFNSLEVFYGIGDSTNVFAEIGYINRVNDSIRNNELMKVNTSNTYYLKSQIVKNLKTNLSVYINYRTLKNEDETITDEQSLNSRLQFNQKIFNILFKIFYLIFS